MLSGSPNISIPVAIQKSFTECVPSHLRGMAEVLLSGTPAPASCHSLPGPPRGSAGLERSALFLFKIKDNNPNSNKGNIFSLFLVTFAQSHILRKYPRNLTKVLSSKKALRFLRKVHEPCGCDSQALSSCHVLVALGVRMCQPSHMEKEQKVTKSRVPVFGVGPPSHK